MAWIVYKTSDNELQHHGIKGQRWGVRRSRDQLNRLAGRKTEGEERTKTGSKNKGGSGIAAKFKAMVAKSKAKKQAEKQAEIEKQKEAELRKKPISELTNEELKSRIARIKLEQEYKNLSDNDVGYGKKTLIKLRDAATDATIEGGKILLKDTLVAKGKKYLGIDDKSSKSASDSLKELAQLAEQTNKIYATKNDQNPYAKDIQDKTSKILGDPKNKTESKQTDSKQTESKKQDEKSSDTAKKSYEKPVIEERNDIGAADLAYYETKKKKKE